MKGKAIPVAGHGGPHGCETSRLPHFIDIWLTSGGEVVSLTPRPPWVTYKSEFHIWWQIPYTKHCWHFDLMLTVLPPVSSCQDATGSNCTNPILQNSYERKNKEINFSLVTCFMLVVLVGGSGVHYLMTKQGSAILEQRNCSRNHSLSNKCLAVSGLTTKYICCNLQQFQIS
jgi:hypothetical protein